MKIFWIIVIIVAALLFIFGAILFALFWFTFGRRDMPAPMVSGKWDPESGWTPYKEAYQTEYDWIQVHITRDFTLKSRDGLKLRGFLIETPGATQTAMLFHGYHGYPQMDFAPYMRYFVGRGMNVFFIDERAMNSSTGKLITYGIRESRDLVEWVDLVNREVPGTSIVLGGVSMGAATVMMALAHNLPENVKAVISDCGYTTPREIIKHTMNAIMPFLPDITVDFVNVICKLCGFSMDDADTRKILAATKTPVCFIHGDADDFVPTSMGIENYNACASKKDLLLVKGAGHAVAGMVDGEGVRAFVGKFLDEVM